VAAFRASPRHEYLIRSIEPPDAHELPPLSTSILSRGPFEREDEIALMRERRSRGRRNEEQRWRFDLRQDRGGARANLESS